MSQFIFKSILVYSYIYPLYYYLQESQKFEATHNSYIATWLHNPIVLNIFLIKMTQISFHVMDTMHTYFKHTLVLTLNSRLHMDSEIKDTGFGNSN